MAEAKSALAKPGQPIDLLVELQLSARYLPAVAPFFSKLADQFLVPLLLGKQQLVLRGSPLVMAANSDLIRQQLTTLASQSSSPLWLARETEVPSYQLLPLLRVWIAINGLTNGVYNVWGPVTRLKLDQLRNMWLWMQYFQVDMKGPGIKEFACNVMEEFANTFDEIKDGVASGISWIYSESTGPIVAWLTPAPIPSDPTPAPRQQRQELVIADAPDLTSLAKTLLSLGVERQDNNEVVRDSWTCWFYALAIVAWGDPQALDRSQVDELLEAQKDLQTRKVEIPVDKLRARSQDYDKVRTLAEQVRARQLTKVSSSGHMEVKVPYNKTPTGWGTWVTVGLPPNQQQVYVDWRDVPSLDLSYATPEERALLEQYRPDLTQLSYFR